MNGAANHISSGRSDPARKIRGVHLLEDEKIVGMLDGAAGLIETPTHQGPLLALTNRRVVSLLDAEDRRETHAASIDKIQGVSIRSNRRPFKPLLQGVVLILVGVLIYLIVGTFSTGIPVNAGITIGALLGGAVALLGILYVVRYLFWEQGGELVFQTGGLELIFPYRSDKSRGHIHGLLKRFFQLQAGLEVEPLYAASATPGRVPLLRTPPEAVPAPAEETRGPSVVEEAPAVPAITVPSPTPARRKRKRRLRPRNPVVRLLRRAGPRGTWGIQRKPRRRRAKAAGVYGSSARIRNRRRLPRRRATYTRHIR